MHDKQPFHVRNAEAVVRAYVNSRLTEDQEFFGEDEPIIEVDGEPLTRRHVDEALTEVME